MLHFHWQYGPLYVWEIAGITFGIISLLKREEQRHWAVIGITICSIRLIGTLSIRGIL